MFGTKQLVILVLWVAAVVLFGLVALQIPDTHYNLVSAGLAFAWAGVILHVYWNSAKP